MNFLRKIRYNFAFARSTAAQFDKKHPRHSKLPLAVPSLDMLIYALSDKYALFCQIVGGYNFFEQGSFNFSLR